MTPDDQQKRRHERIVHCIVRAMQNHGQPASSAAVYRMLSARDRSGFDAALADLVDQGAVEVYEDHRAHFMLRLVEPLAATWRTGRPITPDARGRVSLRAALDRIGRRGLYADAYVVAVDDRGVITLTPVAWTTPEGS